MYKTELLFAGRWRALEKQHFSAAAATASSKNGAVSPAAYHFHFHPFVLLYLLIAGSVHSFYHLFPHGQLPPVCGIQRVAVGEETGEIYWECAK